MIFSVILLIFSFLFEGFISNYIVSAFNNLNVFSTLYSLITFVVIFPYFQNKKKYYILLIIFSLLIDIVYNNTIMLNVLLFLAISLIVKILTTILPDNILMINIISLISVILYHILSYIVLIAVNYNNYTISLLFDICLNSILMTIIYTTIIYLISKNVFERLDLKQIK